MKQLKSNIIACIFIVSGIAVLIACGGEEKKQTDKVIPEQQSSEAIQHAQDHEKDVALLAQAAEINLTEIKLAKLAQSKAVTKDIRELAGMMEDHHTKMMEEVKHMAMLKNVAIPTEALQEGSELYKNVADKKRIDFDREYVNMMVKAHEDAITLFQKAAQESKEVDMISWITDKLLQLNEHLIQANAAMEKLKITEKK